jgi:hypothetical protein
MGFMNQVIEINLKFSFVIQQQGNNAALLRKSNLSQQVRKCVNEVTFDER